MDDRFEVAGGSVVGRAHLRELAWRNNQDAGAWGRTPGALAAVVCDGCGAEPHSEIGARLGARLTLAAVLERVSHGGDVGMPEFWDGVTAQVLARIASLADAMGGSWRRVIHEHFLFTVCGAVVTEATTALFALGDGVMYLNGEPLPLPSFANNAPPYLAYRLLDGASVGWLTSTAGDPSPGPVCGSPGFDDAELRIRVRAALPTANVESILIGTDGVADLAGDGRGGLPGRAIRQFWTDDVYFANPLAITRRLALMNRQHRTVDRGTGTVTTTGGRLHDDTTLVVIKRRGPVAGGERVSC